MGQLELNSTRVTISNSCYSNYQPFCLKVLEGNYPAPSVKDECGELGGFIPDYFLYDPISTWRLAITDSKLMSLMNSSNTVEPAYMVHGCKVNPLVWSIFGWSQS